MELFASNCAITESILFAAAVDLQNFLQVTCTITESILFAAAVDLRNFLQVTYTMTELVVLCSSTYLISIIFQWKGAEIVFNEAMVQLHHRSILRYLFTEGSPGMLLL